MIKLNCKPEVYAKLVDDLTLKVIENRNQTEVFNKLRQIVRTNGVLLPSTTLKRIKWENLVPLMLSKRPEIAVEVRRRLLNDSISNYNFQLWEQAAAIVAPTDKEFKRAAKLGLVTPLVKAKLELPKNCRNDIAVWCLSRNFPQAKVLDELIAEGHFHKEAWEQLLRLACEHGNKGRVKLMGQAWPKDKPIPKICKFKNLDTALLLQSVRPDAVGQAELALMQYKAGNRKESLRLLATTEGYTAWAAHHYPGDLALAEACGTTRENRRQVMEKLAMRKASGLVTLKKLLNKPSWLSVLRNRDASWTIKQLLALNNSWVTAKIFQINPSFPIHDGIREECPGQLEKLLRLRPWDHDRQFWESLKPAQLKRLVPKATRFSEEARDAVLFKDCCSTAMAAHVLKHSKGKLKTNQFLNLRSRPALAVIRAGRADFKEPLNIYTLDRTHLGLPLVRQVLKPGGLIGKVEVSDYEKRSSQYIRACFYLARAGHNTMPELDQLTAYIRQGNKSKEIARYVISRLSELTDCQLTDLYCSAIKAQVAEEVKVRLQKKKPHDSLVKALLHNGDADTFETCFRPTMSLDNDDMVALILAGKWKLLHQIRKSAPKWAKPSDRLFCERTQPYWNKLIDYGFKATTDHYDPEVISLHLARKVWPKAELNRLIYSCIDYSSHPQLLHKLVPAPAGLNSVLLDYYQQGVLDMKLFKHAIAKERSMEYNLAAVQGMLSTLNSRVKPNNRLNIISFVAPKQRWELLKLECPVSLAEEENPYGFPVGGFKEILGAALLEAMEAKIEPKSQIKPAFRLAVAFGNLAEVIKVLRKRNIEGKTPIHDLGQFSLPEREPWNVGEWRKLLMHHSGKGLQMLRLAPRIEQTLGRMPVNMEEAEATAVKSAYLKSNENPALAALCFEYTLSEEQFEDYLALLAKAKQADNCPMICLKADELELPGYQYERLAPGNPEGPLLGEITNCCQHLHGFAKDCAEAGTLDPDASFYVLRKNGVIVAQSFAWRTKDTLVLDSWEGFDMADAVCVPILKKAAAAMLTKDPSIKEVRLGKGGGTPTLDLPSSKACKWKRPLQGMDSSAQYLLAKTA